MEGVTVCGHHPECRVTFGRGGPHIVLWDPRTDHRTSLETISKIYHEGRGGNMRWGNKAEGIIPPLSITCALVTNINVNHHISVHVVCNPCVSLSKSVEQQMLKNKLTFSLLSESEIAQQQVMLENDLKLVNFTPLIWGSEFLYLESPKGGCCSMSDDVSSS